MIFAKACLTDVCHQVTFEHSNVSDDGASGHLHESRRVVLNFNDPEKVTAKATVYVCENKWKNQGVVSAEDPGDLLLEIGSLMLCPGAGCGLKSMTKSFDAGNGHYFAAKYSLILKQHV